MFAPRVALESSTYLDRLYGPLLLLKRVDINFPLALVIYGHLLFFLAHPIAPRWWTALLTVIGTLSWWIFGVFPHLGLE